MIPRRTARMRATPLHLQAGWVVALAIALVPAPGRADDSAARLRAAALVEEGDLLLEELTELDPVRKRDRAEAERLGATEKRLAADSARIEKDVAAYNQAVAQLNVVAAQHARACPSEIAPEAVDECNARGTQLMDQAAALDRRYLALQAQQEDVNARVGQHNRARDAWLAARRENAPKLDANAADSQRWVGVARTFMATPEFAALRKRAGNPAACRQLRLADAGAHFGEQGLKQLHACLKAVLAGS